MKIVIIGGGPAGMIAAIAASKNSSNIKNGTKEVPQILLIEKNEKLGKKLFITGKGRCNLTNDCDKEDFLKNVVRNPKFIYSAYSEFSNNDLKQLVEENGCKLKTERGNRVFPISDKSYDVIDALKNAIKKCNINVKLNTEIDKITIKSDSEEKYDISKSSPVNNKFEITTKDKSRIIADKVIIATGGVSYKSTGSTGDGYKFANSFDINVIEQSPSLVPFNVLEIDDCKMMQGLTLKNISIKIINNSNKIIYSDFGELLFTHFGVSGPTIISASSFVDIAFDSDRYDTSKSKFVKEKISNLKYNNLVLSIDLKPALDEEQLDNRVLRDFENNKNKELKSIIEGLQPSSMVEVFINRLSIINSNNNISKLKVSDVSKDIRKSIVSLLKDFRFTITSKRSFDEAIITRGGIDVLELNPKTMESKKIKGLYFAGEVIDIDALTGGFNIQLAATTGYVAGKMAIYDI